MLDKRLLCEPVKWAPAVLNGLNGGDAVTVEELKLMEDIGLNVEEKGFLNETAEVDVVW